MRKTLRAVMSGLSDGLDRVTPARLYLVVVITALIAMHGLMPETFLVDGATVGLLGVLVIVILVPLLKSATLPGGGGLNFKEDLDRLKEESRKAEEDQLNTSNPVAAPGPDHGDAIGSIPNETSAEGRNTVQHAAVPGESVEHVIDEILEEASRSPRVGLMLLGTELERAVRRLLLASGWATRQSPRSLRLGIERLVEIGVLTHSAASALSLFSTVRNEIVHGGRAASDEEVLRALDAGIPLLRAVMAIPRERNFVAHPGVELFADEAATQPIPDAKGLILRTVSPGGATTSYRIFPTTKDDYVENTEVTWEWGTSKWGESWYRDPRTQDVKHAWTGSLEFTGRRLDEL